MPAAKNQPKTDEDLRALVITKLQQDARTAHLELRVGVLNGIVHLGGAVEGEAQWLLAEQVAGEVFGVRGVVNRIAAPGAPSPSRTVNLHLSNQLEAINEEQS